MYEFMNRNRFQDPDGKAEYRRSRSRKCGTAMINHSHGGIDGTGLHAAMAACIRGSRFPFRIPAHLARKYGIGIEQMTLKSARQSVMEKP